jgi:hypothetical protein
MNQILVFVIVHRMGLPYATALVIIVMLIPALTFVLGRYWAFRKPMDAEHANARKQI